MRLAKAHASITGVQADIRFLNVRLKALAKSRHASVNRLFDELATVALAQHDMA